MEQNLTRLIDQIDSLDTDARRQIYDRLAYQMAVSANMAEFSENERDVWDAVCLASGERRALSSLLDNNKRSRNTYRRMADSVCQYLHAGCRQPLSRPQFLGLLAIAANCLVDFVKVQHNNVVTLRYMFDALAKMPDAMDDGFPGYAKARMLGQLVTVADTKSRQVERMFDRYVGV